jgi:hypothetical protein
MRSLQNRSFGYFDFIVLFQLLVTNLPAKTNYPKCTNLPAKTNYPKCIMIIISHSINQRHEFVNVVCYEIRVQ